MTTNKELTELAEFLCELGNGIGNSLVDGKISIQDAANFARAAVTAPAALMGITQVSEEYFNLDVEAKNQLKAFIASKLALPASQENIAAIAENVISVAVELNTVLKSILNVKAAVAPVTAA